MTSAEFLQKSISFFDCTKRCSQKHIEFSSILLIGGNYDHFFAIIFLVGLIMAFICQRIKLPRIIGMLVTGIVTGPYVLDFLDPKILGISSELRQIALIIILIKAGLSLNISDLKKIGRPAILMSFLPALFEIGAFVAFAPALLHITLLEAAIGSVPLSLGLSCGNTVLSIAVLSILITAPLGAILMDLSCKKLLKREIT